MFKFFRYPLRIKRVYYWKLICIYFVYNSSIQAFGVGAFEDDDDDIYAVDSMENYDITMSGEKNPESTYGWTKPAAITGLFSLNIYFYQNAIQRSKNISDLLRHRQIYFVNVRSTSSNPKWHPSQFVSTSGDEEGG